MYGMIRNNKKLYFLFGAAGIIAAGAFESFVLFSSKDFLRATSFLQGLAAIGIDMGENATEQETGQEAQTPAEDSESPDENGDLTAYSNLDYGFSFRHSKTTVVTAFGDDVGDIILMQDQQERREAQIFIAPFDEEGPITPKRIKKDLSHAVVDDPQQIVFGADKNTPALLFWSNEPYSGKTREIWFTHSGNFYQVSTPAENDYWIGKILETWSFGDLDIGYHFPSLAHDS